MVFIIIIKSERGNIITLVIDETELEEYLKYYFNTYPNRNKAPIDRPMHPSLNEWTNQRRNHQNATKQKWHEFVMWFMKKYGLEDYGIETCKITYILTFPTRHRRDPDNFTQKFINDALTDSGFLTDDSFTNVLEATYIGEYEKGVTKTTIEVEILSYKDEAKDKVFQTLMGN